MTELADVLALYERWGSERYDEDVAQLDHALQTAARATTGPSGRRRATTLKGTGWAGRKSVEVM